MCARTLVATNSSKNVYAHTRTAGAPTPRAHTHIHTGARTLGTRGQTAAVCVTVCVAPERHHKNHYKGGGGGLTGPDRGAEKHDQFFVGPAELEGGLLEMADVGNISDDAGEDLRA